ncbi:RDD domain-containing protein [Mycobacteroides abscessus subsp. bolletii]|uniref:RDD family protein n=1 Tax=Mycobacteroides abscessus TaxID=36809 RepID=UPI0009A818B7|nr:RDD family protein [Mycobacteroides abscessus]SKK58333.1 RDD domain-containing protein [Mycobacteroides abscessus subsp. bolletii]
MARDLGSWLSGPGSVEGAGNSRYPGERLGLPESGPGSAAPLSRRLLALLIDWLIAGGLALFFVKGNLLSPSLSSAQLLTWLGIGVLAVRLWRFTPGQYMAGLQVAPADGTDSIGIGRAFIRNLLIALIVPPLITDIDGRGLHDRVTRTVVIRVR